MGELWNALLIKPLVNGLVFFYKLTGDLGIAIILLIVVVRLVLLPLTLPSLKTAQKTKELAPYIERLKKRHKGDKTKFLQAQAELYRQHGINPAAGCIPQILQFVIIIALFSVFYQIFPQGGDGAVTAKLNEFLWPALHLSQDAVIKTQFLFWDLTKPNVITLPGFPFPLPGILLFLVAIVQLLSSKMMIPIVNEEGKVARKTPGATDDMMVTMQRSMLWTFPATTLVIGYVFPSGVVLCWFVFSLFQIVQQYITSGWGGLASWLSKAGLIQLRHGQNKQQES